MSSTCSSWRRRSPARARASSGSKPSIVMDVRNMCDGTFWGEETGRELYRNEAAAALVVSRRPGGSFATMPPPAMGRGCAGRAGLLQQVFHHRVPCLGEVVAVVAAATEGQHAPVA